MIQLVKHKEYRRVSTVYILIYHEVVMRRAYGRHEICLVSQMVTYLVCDELRYGFKSAYEQS